MALPAEAHGKIPKAMLDFHVSGGVCRGPLLVTRGNWLGRILATLGQLPEETPGGRRRNPADVVVTSTASVSTPGGVDWARLFPRGCISGQMAPPLESRWYYDEVTGLAVDSFTWWGIKDFAAFGFVLEPMEVPGHEAASGLLGFRHVTKRAWVLGVPVPLALSLSADGVSLPHEDGRGWRVEVAVEHPLVGLVVAYSGDVRVVTEK